MNYLLPRDVVRLCARARRHRAHLRAAAVDPARRAGLAGGGRREHCATSPTPAAGCRARRSTGCARSSRRRRPFLMYGLTEAFRSTYLDRPRSTAGPTRSARRSRTPRSSSSGRTARVASRARRASWCTAARWWRWATGTTRSARPSGSGRRRAATVSGGATPEIAVWSGDTVVADEEGFLYFVGRTDEMIKTSGYRVSPTEIEEAAYATGLVRDAVALGVDDPRARPARSCSSSAAADAGASTPRLLIACLKRDLPLYMVPARRRRARRAAALAERQVRPRPAARRSSGSRDASTRPSPPSAASTASSPSAASRSSGSPSASARRRSSPTTAAAHRAGRARCAPTLPDRDRSELRGQGQPDAGGRAAPRAGWSTRFDVASAGEMRDALDTPMPAERVSFAGPGQDARPSSARRSPPASPSSWSRRPRPSASLEVGERSASGRASPSASTRTSRSRAPACGWAAARSSSASTPSRCRRCSRELGAADVDFLGFHVFAGSQNLNADDHLRGAAQDRRARAASSPSRCPAPSAT